MTEFLIKSTIAMGVLLGLYYILFEREKMHRFNRFYLITALVFSLALPFINIPVYVEAEAPAQPVIMDQPLTFGSQSAPKALTNKRYVTTKVSAAEITEAPSINYWPYMGWSLYLLVVLVLSIRFAMNILHFYRLKRNNLTISYRGTSLVLLTTDVLPHTFLSNIYLSKNEYENRQIATALFMHEFVHVKQQHTLDILFIETLKTIFWFNPLLYFYKKAIQLNHEFLADAKVIGSTGNAANYQTLLLEKATLGKAFSIASNFNFSLTKKRFIMMTKTTGKTKSRLLKVVVVPAITGLLYFLSTETVVLAKTTTAKPTVLIPPTTGTPAPDESSESTIDSLAPEALTAPAPEEMATSSARMNEYYSGVRIMIEDAKEDVSIDKPYEMLTAQERYYLPDAPGKQGGNGISDEDYDYSVNIIYKYEGGGLYYIDDKKVSREEILRHKKDDFASYAIKSHGATMVDGKLVGDNQIFFYTYGYYDRYLKNINDHYPDRTLKITITENPGKTWMGVEEFTDEEKASGMSDAEIMNLRRKKELEADYYPTVEQIKKQNRTLEPHFPGGEYKFNEYISRNIDFGNRRIAVKYTINTDGTISNVIVRNIKDEALAAKIKHVFENSPKWIPGQENGKPCQVSYSSEFPAIISTIK